MTSWQAVWYIAGVLLYPVGFGVLTLGLMQLGVRTEIAYLIGVFGLPFIWLPLNRFLMQEAYKREGLIGTAEEVVEEPFLTPVPARPLIR